MPFSVDLSDTDYYADSQVVKNNKIMQKQVHDFDWLTHMVIEKKKNQIQHSNLPSAPRAGKDWFNQIYLQNKYFKIYLVVYHDIAIVKRQM